MPPRRKGTYKLEEEIKKEVKREMRKSEKDMLVDLFRQGHHRKLMPSEAIKMKRMLKDVNGGLHIGYIKTLLFPEQFSYEIPMPLSSVSYSKFTDKQEINITPGTDGSGMLVWYPRTNGGPQLFYFAGGTLKNTYTSAGIVEGTFVQSLPGSGEGIDVTATYGLKESPSTGYKFWRPSCWQWGLPTYSFQNFSQTALVGASISIQYIGRVELEAGLMVGGQLHGIALSNINTEEIENSQWVTRCRPGEGLRFLYLPKDQSDFEFYPAQEGTAYNQGANPQPLIVAATAIKAPEPNSVGLDVIQSGTVASIPISAAAIAGITSTDTNPPYATADTVFPLINGIVSSTTSGVTSYTVKGISKSVAPLTGAYSYLNYVRNSSCIAIYFQGMDTSKAGSQFRVDITRKFIGMPLGKTRDIVDLTRPDKTYDAQKTFNAVSMIANQSPIGGHTLKEIDKIVDPLIDTLPNLAYLMDNGGLSYSKSLDQLVSQLQNPMTGDKGLTGQLQGNNDRFYQYFL